MSEYAPEYTKKERIVLGIKMLAWIVLIYVFFKFWFFDWFDEYSKNANCYSYDGIKRLHIIFYGIFVCVPLSFALLLFLTEGIRSIKVIRLGQDPLPNEKVLKSTKYKHGIAAKIKPLFLFSMIFVLLGISVWGGFQAYDITKDIKLCTVNKSDQ